MTGLYADFSPNDTRHSTAFVTPTICYAFMQSVGLVNDHVTTCFRN